MIKQYVIDELRQKMDLHEVITHFIPVKKNIACCPFHGEKTPSFHIWKNKQIYKCFGCGKSGDAIRFVQEHEKKTFIEAIEWLCSFYNITVEYDQQAQQESEEKKEARQEMLGLVSWAHKKFEDLLHTLPEEAGAMQYLLGRGYDTERIKAWSLGFAPDDWKFLTTPVINMGKHNAAVDCGLVVSESGKNYDMFRNRIMIPIHDQNGILIGFGGRMVPGGDPKAEKKYKYTNSKESLIYSKSKVWYGLWQAQKAINAEGFVYIVEGFMDVQSMHDHGMCNTVGSCGTEIDEAQVKLLKRYTEHVVFAYDGDDAGVNKAIKNIDLFLKHDFKVGVIQFPGKMDPDEYIGQLVKENEPTDALLLAS